MNLCAYDNEEFTHGGYQCECYNAVRNTIDRRSQRNYHKVVSVEKKNHELVCIQ